MGIINSIGAYFQKVLGGFTFGTQTDRITVTGNVSLEAADVTGSEYTFPPQSGLLTLGSGSVGTIPKFITEYQIGDSLLSETGSIVTISGSVNVLGNVSASIFTGSFYGDGTNLTGVTSYTDADTLDFINSINVVSGSSQISYPLISNIPSGIVSGSSQLTSSYDIRYDKILTFNDTPTIDLIRTTNTITAVAQGGVVSGSSQLTSSYDLRYTLSGSIPPLPSGVISGSSQLTSSYDIRYELTGRGIASGSSQFTSSYDTRYLNTGGDSVVSGSAQIVSILVPLNSFSASINSYTASNNTTNTTQNNRLDQLSTFSGSIQTQVNGLSAATSSYEKILTFNDTSTINFTRSTNTITAVAQGGVVSGSSQVLSFGTDNQIPHMNAGGTNFEYTASLVFDSSLNALRVGIDDSQVGRMFLYGGGAGGQQLGGAMFLYADADADANNEFYGIYPWTENLRIADGNDQPLLEYFYTAQTWTTPYSLSVTGFVTGSGFGIPGGTSDGILLADGTTGSLGALGAGTVTSVSAGNGMNFTTITGAGPVTMGTPSTLTSATTNATTTTSHTHAITTGISNTNIVKIDSSTVADNEYARFTASGLESRSPAEVLSDIGAASTSSLAITDDYVITGTGTGIQGESTLRYNTTDGLRITYPGTTTLWIDSVTVGGSNIRFSPNSTGGYVRFNIDNNNSGGTTSYEFQHLGVTHTTLSNAGTLTASGSVLVGNAGSGMRYENVNSKIIIGDLGESDKRLELFGFSSGSGIVLDDGFIKFHGNMELDTVRVTNAATNYDRFLVMNPSGGRMWYRTGTQLLSDIGGLATGSYATSTVPGLIELFSDSVQTVAANIISVTASRTYGIQLNSSGQAVVNVPWANTTYSEISDANLQNKTGTTTGLITGRRIENWANVKTLVSGSSQIVSILNPLNTFSGSIQTQVNGLSSATGSYVTAASTFGTDNRILRSDGTSRGAQSSAVTIDDSGNITTSGYSIMGGTSITAGKVNAQMTSGVAGWAHFAQANGVNNWTGLYMDASNNFSYQSYNASNVKTVQIVASGSSYFNGGNVGIGTSTPTSSLHIDGPNHTGVASNWDTGCLIVEQTNGYRMYIDGNDIDVITPSKEGAPLYLQDYSKSNVIMGGDITGSYGLNVLGGKTLPTPWFSETFTTDLGDFTTSGSVGFARVTTSGSDDSFSAKSQNSTGYSTSQLVLTKTTTVPVTLLQFDYKVSSEDGYDYLQVLIDGTVVFQATGEVDWTTKNLYIYETGSHQIIWSYIKDPNTDTGQDSAWVDNVKLINITPPVQIDADIGFTETFDAFGQATFHNDTSIAGNLTLNKRYAFDPVTGHRRMSLSYDPSSGIVYMAGHAGSSQPQYALYADGIQTNFTLQTLVNTSKLRAGVIDSTLPNGYLELADTSAKIRFGSDRGSDPSYMMTVSGSAWFKSGLDVSGTVTAPSFVGDLTGSATQVMTSQLTTNTNYPLIFTTSQTNGNKSLYTDSALGCYINPSTDTIGATAVNATVMTATTFSGTLSGNASSANYATQLSVSNLTTSASYPFVFASSATSGVKSLYTDSAATCYINPSTNTIGASQFIGGNVSFETALITSQLSELGTNITHFKIRGGSGDNTRSGGIRIQSNNAALDGAMYFVGSKMMMGSITNHAVGIITNNTVKMTLNASGRVSIGNLNDTYNLDVTGTGRYTSILTLDDDLVFSARTTTDGHIQLYNGSTSTGYAIGVENSTTFYRASTYHRWYLNTLADGGTSDYMELSTTRLQVNAETATQQVVLTNTSNVDKATMVYNATDTSIDFIFI